VLFDFCHGIAVTLGRQRQQVGFDPADPLFVDAVLQRDDVAVRREG
jgi:hypothetical protein